MTRLAQGQHGVPIGVVPVGGQPILHLHALIQHPVGLEYLQKSLRAQLIELHRAGLKKIALGVRVVQLDLGLAGGGGSGGRRSRCRRGRGGLIPRAAAHQGDSQGGGQSAGGETSQGRVFHWFLPSFSFDSTLV